MLFSNHVSRRSLERTEVTHKLLENDFFRNTISWKCFVKNDRVRSSLIELQSFPQSQIDVDPIHCVLMSLPCNMQVLCMTRCIQVDRIRILRACPWDPQAERILSVCCSNFDLQVCINPELMMECKLIALPTLFMYWKKLLRLTTLSCTVRSIRLRPESP